MITCFLFFEDLKAEHCVGVKVYNKTATVSEPQHLSITECHNWQKAYPTTIVLNSQHFCVYRLNLPKLSKNKIYSAIGYALEDKIIHSKETLHIAIQSKKNGETIAVYCEKNLLDNLIFMLKEHQINYNCITIDWCAVAAGTALLLPKRVLVNHSDFIGSLQLQDFLLYSERNWEQGIIHYTKNTEYLKDLPKAFILNHASLDNYQWLSDKLAYQDPLNLLQNDYKIPNTVTLSQTQKKLFGKIYLIWLLGISLIFLLSYSMQGLYKFWLQIQYNRAIEQQIQHYGGNFLDNENAWHILSGSVKVMRKLNLHAKKISFNDHKLYLQLKKLPALKRKQLQQKLKLLDLEASIKNRNNQSDTWIIQYSKE